MLDFKEKKSKVSLEAEQNGITYSISEEQFWDRKIKKRSDKTHYRVSAAVEDDLNYNNIEFVVASVEEAQALCSDIAKFFDSVKPVLLIVPDTED